MSIQVGDKVKCIDNSGAGLGILVVGNEYELEGIDTYNGNYFLVGRTHQSQCWLPSRFVPITSNNVAPPPPQTTAALLTCSICGNDSKQNLYSKSWEALGTCGDCRLKAGYKTCKYCSNYTCRPQDGACLYCSISTTDSHKEYVSRGGKVVKNISASLAPSPQTRKAIDKIADIAEEKCWELLKPRIEKGYCKCGVLKAVCSYHREDTSQQSWQFIKH